MKKFNKFESAQVKKGSVFELLPKGAYVLKILKAVEEENKNGNGSHIKVAFDVAEGEYKDFYKKQFDASPNEDKHWPYDGVYNLTAPDDSSPQWMIDNFGTFVAALEDSNDGYHWDWDESKWKGLVIGALFRNEQSQKDGTIYDHNRPFWFRKADDIRNNKYGRLPKDKLVDASTIPAPADKFVPLGDIGEDDVPF